MNENIKTYYSEARQTIFYAGYNDMEKLEKTSTESVQVEWEFSSILPENEVLKDTSNVTITDEDGLSVTSSLVGAIEVINSTKLRTVLSTGTNSIDYKVKFEGISDPHSYKYEGYLLLQIRDKTI